MGMTKKTKQAIRNTNNEAIAAKAERAATHAYAMVNITVIDKDALPKMAQIQVATDGRAWAHTDAWRKICERAVALAVDSKVGDGQPVFIAEHAGNGMGQYTVGELKRELEG